MSTESRVKGGSSGPSLRDPLREPSPELPWRELTVTLAVVMLSMGPLVREGLLGGIAGTVTLLSVGSLVIWYLGRRDTTLLLLLVGAFALRLFVVGADTWLGLFPKLDAVGYHVTTEAVAQGWMDGDLWTGPGSRTTKVYATVVAPLYVWFGPHAVLARVFNALLGMISVYLVYRIGRVLWERRQALAGALTLALFPSIVRVQGEYLRDALVLVVILFGFYALVRETLGTWKRLLGLSVSIVSISLLRPETLFPLSIGIGMYFLLPGRHPRPADGAASWVRRIAKRATSVLVGVTGFFVLWGVAGGPGGHYFERLDPESLSNLRNNLATGGSSYLGDVQFTSWFDVLLFLPIGAFYFLFTPFPWQVHNVLSLAAALENVLIFYPLTLLAVIGFRKTALTRGCLSLVGYLLAGAILYGLIEGNAGTALRHRVQFTWVIFLFAGPGLDHAYRWIRSSTNLEDWLSIR